MHLNLYILSCHDQSSSLGIAPNFPCLYALKNESSLRKLKSANEQIDVAPSATFSVNQTASFRKMSFSLSSDILCVVNNN